VSAAPARPGATAAEREAIGAVLGADPHPDATAARRVVRRSRATAQRRSLLLPALRELQARTGRVSPGAVAELARRLDLGEAEIFGVASFYALLDTGEGRPVKLLVCDDVACRARGAQAVLHGWERLRAAAGRAGDAPEAERSPCLGLCDRAPAALIVRTGAEAGSVRVAPAGVQAIAAALVGPAAGATGAFEPAAVAEGAHVLARVGRVDPGDLDAYRAAGGYAALRRALEIGREAVVGEVTEAGLTGRGGAGFPTGAKWRMVAAQAAGPHYVVANGDESEPGTFKDRVLMEEDPLAVLEGLTVAGYATGAERGYVYVRGEYDLAARRLAHAAAQARGRGLLGDDILGRGVRFDVEIRAGAGAYICGEETALLNSIEGYAGEPRNKPPFPAGAGLFDRPTAVNNIETLCQVVAILRDGPAAFRALGTTEAPGTRLFAVSGSVVRPGVYEAALGTTLGDLVERAGGIAPGRRVAAVLLGGAAGAFVGPEALSTPLTPAAVQAIGATLGSGAVVVFDETVDLPDIVRRIARFFRDESCGQCVPCRIGTVRQEEMVVRLGAGRPLGSVAEELARFGDLARAMRDASICGLGQTAASAVESALRLGILGGGGASA